MKMPLNIQGRLTYLLMRAGPGSLLTMVLLLVTSLVCVVGPFFALLNSLAFILSLTAFFRLTTGHFQGSESMRGKTVLVTGGAQGIGRQTATELARRGARVLLVDVQITLAKKTARQIAKNTGNTEVEALFVDLGSFQSVRQLAKYILQREERLDVLINNAGVLQLPQVVADAIRKDTKGLDPHYVVNYLGPFLLTNLLLPLLTRSAPSRIIMVSSVMHKTGEIDRAIREHFRWRENADPNRELYSNSKLAVILFAVELGERLREQGVTVNALHPGVVCTAIMEHLPKWKRVIFRVIALLWAKNATEGSQTSLFLAISRKVQSVSGKYFVDCRESAPAECSSDRQLRRRLWEMSHQVTQHQTPNGFSD